MSTVDWRTWAEDFLAPWNRRDVDGVLASVPDDFAWEFPSGTQPNGAVYRGKQELRAFLERFFAMVPDLNYAIVTLTPGTAHLVIEVRMTGFNVETRQALNFDACDIILFDGDIPRAKRSYRKVVTPN